jgi:hypothetical protein
VSVEASKPLRPAVFLDRDGTVNVEVHYLSQPEQLVLLPTVARTISRLNTLGIAVVVVTNQAGIAWISFINSWHACWPSKTRCSTGSITVPTIRKRDWVRTRSCASVASQVPEC